MLRACDPSTDHGASYQSVLQQSCVGVIFLCWPIVAPSLNTWPASSYLQHTCLIPLLMSRTGPGIQKATAETRPGPKREVVINTTGNVNAPEMLIGRKQTEGKASFFW